MTFQPNNMIGPPPKLGPENRALEAWLDMFYRNNTVWFAKERTLGDGLEYNSLDEKQVKVQDPVYITDDGAVSSTGDARAEDVLFWIAVGV